MSPDDIDRIALGLYEVLGDLNANLNENDDWDEVLAYMHRALEPYVTRERNYN